MTIMVINGHIEAAIFINRTKFQLFLQANCEIKLLKSFNVFYLHIDQRRKTWAFHFFAKIKIIKLKMHALHMPVN